MVIDFDKRAHMRIRRNIAAVAAIICLVAVVAWIADFTYMAGGVCVLMFLVFGIHSLEYHEAQRELDIDGPS